MADPTITHTQKSLIHIAIAQLGIDDETYRLMLAGYGTNTCKYLSYIQASALIDDLKKKGFRIKRKRIRKPAPKKTGAAGTGSQERTKPSNVVFLPTKAQLGLIEHLRADIIWRVHDGYHRWVKKFLGRTYIKNEREAQKVIEALKGMMRNQQSAVGRMQKAEGEKPDGRV